MISAPSPAAGPLHQAGLDRAAAVDVDSFVYFDANTWEVS